MRIVRPTLILIGIVQIILGLVFLIPNGFAGLLGLPDAPAWATWMLTMFSARAFGFGYGMLIAARDPRRHRSWIIAMIGVQAVDWLGTMAYVLTGTLTLATVTTAAFLPLVFIGILWRPAADTAPTPENLTASV
jgi:hypothetical protein